MHLVIIAVTAFERQALLPGLVPQLLVQVEPFQHTLPVEEFPSAQLAKLVARVLLALFAQVAPQLEQSDEIRLLMGEAFMRLVGRALRLQRPFTRVLNTQTRGEHQQIFQAPLARALHDHAGQANIQRPAGQLPTQSGRPAIGIHRAQFEQQLVGIADHSRRR